MPPKPALMTPLAWILLGGLALLWGTSFLSNRLALQGMGPMTVVAIRTGGAAVLLWIAVLVQRSPLPRDPRVIPRFLFIGLLNCALPFGLIVWGQQFIASGLAGILNASAALFGVAVAAMVFRDEHLTPRRIAGVIVGFLGVVIAIGPEALRGLNLTSAGQFAIVGASLCYAFGGAYTRVAARNIAPGVAAAGMLTAAAVWMIPAMLIFEGAPGFDWPLRVDLALLWLVIGCTVAAYLLYFRLLAIAGSGNTSLVTLLIPPVAITAGTIAFGERLTISELLGFAVIAAGLCILNGWPLRMKPRDVPRRAR
ncbi:DMT family transporter [Paenirhodobacter populi]|uniref:DMT family transporter n=1 Tax=Paenirhodobacter populi TaxID=2306993 RepID=UPI001F4F5D85|nr:DMT family transporter [Sinirhodobacter populi]